MSDAIAIVCEALAERLRSLDPNTQVELSAPKRPSGRSRKLALWLYRIEQASGPMRTAPSRSAPAGPSVGLHFLVVPSGSSAVETHRLLGKAITAIHDRPLLERAELDAAVVRLGLAAPAVPFAPIQLGFEQLDTNDLAAIWTSLEGLPFQATISIEARNLLLFPS